MSVNNDFLVEPDKEHQTMPSQGYSMFGLETEVSFSQQCFLDSHPSFQDQSQAAFKVTNFLKLLHALSHLSSNKVWRKLVGKQMSY